VKDWNYERLLIERCIIKNGGKFLFFNAYLGTEIGRDARLMNLLLVSTLYPEVLMKSDKTVNTV
jgi:hypothetical protein